MNIYIITVALISAIFIIAFHTAKKRTRIICVSIDRWDNDSFLKVMHLLRNVKGKKKGLRYNETEDTLYFEIIIPYDSFDWLYSELIKIKEIEITERK